VEAGGLSDGTFLHYRAEARTLDAVGAYLENDVTATDGDTPERVPVALVTPSVFTALGARPALGRLFVEADAAERAQTVVISHALWTRRYGGDPAVLGRTIELNRAPKVIVGVLPAGFDFPRPETQVWYALGVDASAARVRDLTMQGVARLAPGATAAAAERELARLVPRLAGRYADATPEFLRESRLRPVVRPLRDAVVGAAARPLLALLWAAAGVLVVAWANVVALALVRAGRRERAVAVARALGASGGDVAREWLAEAVLLAAAGGALGLVLANALVTARFGFAPGQLPRLHELRPGGTLVAVAAALAAATALLLAAVSFARARRLDVPRALRGATARASAPREWLRVQRALVATQVALAVALLAGSGVLVRSVRALRQADLGFVARDVVTLALPLPFRGYGTYREAAALHAEVLGRLRAVPGVAAAEVTTALPLDAVPASLVQPVAADGDAGTPAPRATVGFATPGYFAALGIPLRAGRTFAAGDVADGTPRVVLSAALARALFGAADPIGRRVRLAAHPRTPAYAVVGVAGDTPGETIAGGPAPVLYFPVLDDLRAAPDVRVAVPYVPREGTVLVVRTALPAGAVVGAVRAALRAIDPKLPVANVRTMGARVDAATARTRLTTLLLLAAAGSTLLLAVVGVYGTVAYAVGERLSELGVRIALGATPGDVRRRVIGDGVGMAAAGVALGALLAVALTRLLAGMLYGVRPHDPLTLAATAALLLALGAAASAGPARRAARVDPVRALRAE
jgi:predicted permease